MCPHSDTYLCCCRYAKSSKEAVLSWNKFTREYFTERETLVSVLLLVDASIPPMAIDVACADWFAEAEVRRWGGCSSALHL